MGAKADAAIGRCLVDLGMGAGKIAGKRQGRGNGGPYGPGIEVEAVRKPHARVFESRALVHERLHMAQGELVPRFKGCTRGALTRTADRRQIGIGVAQGRPIMQSREGRQLQQPGLSVRSATSGSVAADHPLSTAC